MRREEESLVIASAVTTGLSLKQRSSDMRHCSGTNGGKKPTEYARRSSPMRRQKGRGKQIELYRIGPETSSIGYTA